MIISKHYSTTNSNKHEEIYSYVDRDCRITAHVRSASTVRTIYQNSCVDRSKEIWCSLAGYQYEIISPGRAKWPEFNILAACASNYACLASNSWWRSLTPSPLSIFWSCLPLLLFLASILCNQFCGTHLNNTEGFIILFGELLDIKQTNAVNENVIWNIWTSVFS